MNRYEENSIYETLKAANVELDHHESDLYVKRTTASDNIIAGYKYKSNVTTFKSQIDGLIWFDIPFAYSPYWEAKQATA